MGHNLKKLFDSRSRLKTLFRINNLNFYLKAARNLKVEAWTILKVKMQKCIIHVIMSIFLMMWEVRKGILRLRTKFCRKKYFPSHSYMFSLPVTFNVINLPVFLLWRSPKKFPITWWWKLAFHFKRSANTEQVDINVFASRNNMHVLCASLSVYIYKYALIYILYNVFYIVQKKKNCNFSVSFL